MRILGGHDFFDSALSLGRDENLVFVRNKIEPFYDKKVDDLFCPESNGKFYYGGPINITKRDSKFSRYVEYVKPFTIVFAGKIYHCIQIGNEPGDVFITKNSFEEHCNQNSYEFKYNSDEFFALKDVSSRQLDFLIENKVGIMTLGGYLNTERIRKISVNCDGLKDISFQKIIDPFTAMQELSMFVGGVLTENENKMIQISNEDKIHKHGFDKFSFRKLKENS